MRSRRVDALVAQFDRQAKFCAGDSAADWRQNRHRRAVDRQIVFPWALLVGQQLHSDLIFLDRAGVHYPVHRAARFLVVALHSDHVAHFQFALDARSSAPSELMFWARAVGKMVVPRRSSPTSARAGPHSGEVRFVCQSMPYPCVCSCVSAHAIIPPSVAPRYCKVCPAPSSEAPLSAPSILIQGRFSANVSPNSR